ncbi:MAG: thermonuclease family protein [archaeon]
MKPKRRIIFFLVIILLFLISYSPLDNLLKKEFGQTKIGFVSRIVDGDTIELQTGEHVRLLGINTPEKGEEYYDEAKKFLEEEILNKTITLKFGKEKKDLYNRTLAYIFLGKENVNQEIISNGFANAYFPSGKDAYFLSFLEEWKNCVEKNVNYCESSKNICKNCITLEQLDYNKQKVILKNICGFECSLNAWQIKDEGRKKFIFPEFILEPNKEIAIIIGKNQTNGVLLWERETYVWTKTGDTLFLRDSEGKLVLWQNY